jgi:hypothetical protein
MSFVHAETAVRVREILATNSLGVEVITEPDSQTPRESILVDFDVTDFEFRKFKGAGQARPITATFTLRVGVETHVPGSSAVGAQARWFAMAGEVLDLLRADPTLQASGAIVSLLGMTGQGSIRGPFTSRLPDNSGYACIGDVFVPFRSDVC